MASKPMPGNTRNSIRRDWVISCDCRLWGSVFKQTQEPQAKAFAASIGLPSSWQTSKPVGARLSPPT
jgi:hypothetical protein